MPATRKNKLIGAVSVVAVAVLTSVVMSQAQGQGKGTGNNGGGGTTYYIAVSNITNLPGQMFGPIVVAHLPDEKPVLFPSSLPFRALEDYVELQEAEGIFNWLSERGTAAWSGEVNTFPGQTTTVILVLQTKAAPNAPGRIVVVAPMLPTNDGFMFADTVDLPPFNSEAVIYAIAHDAGTEENDELCASIPGEFWQHCRGPGGTGAPPGEGVISVHRGITGEAHDNHEVAFSRLRDWNNPIARIVITPLSAQDR